MSLKEAEFWRGCEEHHELAEEFERNIEIITPNTISCWCSDNCTWAASRVKYYEYRGETL